MGRNAQPIDILTAKGKKHLTKREIASRKESEIKLGTKTFTCPDYVKTDSDAYKKWKEMISIYRKTDLISSGDLGLLARYCKTHSEYLVLLKSYQRVSEIHYDCDSLNELLDETDEEDRYIYSYKVKKQLRDLFAINALMSIETAINKKQDMLIKMEDRMFLNPLAKVKNVPKEKPPEPKDANAGMFGE